jgi:hypothetical protein
MFQQDFQDFKTLQPYFIPAIYHKLAVGKNNVYQLSVPFDGEEVIIHSNKENFIHAGFNDVITGAVLRLQEMFKPEELKLKVAVYQEPTLEDLSLTFELYNTISFTIDNEEYNMSIIGSYSYKNKGEVRYHPVIYREVCTNGMIAKISNNLVETIPADRIFDFGCEWSRCSFDAYCERLTSFYEMLKMEDLFDPEDLNLSEHPIEDRNEKVEEIFSPRETSDHIDSASFNYEPEEEEVYSIMTELFGEEYDSTDDLRAIIKHNFDELGTNQYGLLNILTDYISRETDWEVRLDRMRILGDYVESLMDEKFHFYNHKWSKSPSWSQLQKIASSNN